MANIDNVQLPDGSSYNIVDNTSGFATQNYVDSAVSSVTKTTIGLGNVDNTSDLNKPISTATQTALDTLDEDKADKTDIATVESGTTASRAYSVGELVYVSGILYRVKTAIASGATFTDGTNVEPANVSDVMGDKVNKAGDTMSGVLTIDAANGTTSAVGTSRLNIGNTTPSGTAGNSTGYLFLYGNSNRYARLSASGVTSNRNIELPDKAGTVALTSASFTTISSTNESGFCKNVAKTLNSKMNSNTWITDGFVWAGNDYFICTAVKIDGMVLGTLQSASMSIPMYTFNYVISSDTIRICKFTATAI